MSTSGRVPDKRRNFGPMYTENHLNFNNIGIDTSVDKLPAYQNDFNKGDILMFYETVPTLQGISSLGVAVTLWRRVISLKRNSACDSISTIDELDVHRLIHEINAPPMIKSFIQNYVGRVENEIEFWLRYYNNNLFKTNYGDLMFCCWLPSGEIDQGRTALNMLSNSRLTLIDRFRIMCRFCLVDEIKKLPADSLPSYFVNRIDFSRYSLMFYWISCMKDDFDEIILTNEESIASRMITASDVDTWSAIEYFWDQLSTEEQTSKIEELLNGKPAFQKKLFAKMSESQKFHLICKMPMKIMTNFLDRCGQEQFALKIWIYIRNFVDGERFEEMMYALTSVTHSEIDLGKKIEFLVDVWNNSPDHLKKLAYKPGIIHNIITFHSIIFNTDLDFNIKFLLAYLSYASPELRKNIIFELPKKSSHLVIASVADQLIKLCLPDAKDVIMFKRNVLTSNFIQDCISETLNGDNFYILNNFLDCYCSDTKTRMAFCSRILITFTVQHFPIFNVNCWIEVMKFMEVNIFFDVPDQWLILKKNVLLMVVQHCTSVWSNSNELSKIIGTAVQTLDRENLERFKNAALRQVQGCYVWDTVEENVINGFLLWCCNYDPARLRGFKTTLSIDDIFKCKWDSVKMYDVFWRKPYASAEFVHEVFARLNRCLFWYFEDVEVVKSFKLEKVFEYCDDHTSMFSRFSNEGNDVFTSIMLPWFFEGDRNAIQLFKETYCDQRFVHMV